MLVTQDDDFLLNSVQSLVDRIPNYLFASNFDGSDRSFLPEQHLSQLVTLETIVTELGRFTDYLYLIQEHARESRRQEYNPEFRQRLASWIFHHAPRMFATMIHCNLNPLFLLLSMQKCQELQFTDEQLPLSSSTEPPKGRNKSIWTRARRQDFWDKQWRFLVPVFEPERYQYDHEYNCIFPFIKSNEAPRIGAFSVVHKVTIHPGHQRHRGVDEVSYNRSARLLMKLWANRMIVCHQGDPTRSRGEKDGERMGPRS